MTSTEADLEAALTAARQRAEQAEQRAETLRAAINTLALAWANEDKVAQGLAFADLCALAQTQEPRR